MNGRKLSGTVDFLHTGFKVPVNRLLKTLDVAGAAHVNGSRVTRIMDDAPYVDVFLARWCTKCDAPYLDAPTYDKCHTNFVCRFCHQDFLQHRPNDGRGRPQEVCSGAWCRSKFQREKRGRWNERQKQENPTAYFLEIARRHRLIPVGERYNTTIDWCVRMRHEGTAPDDAKLTLRYLHSRMQQCLNEPFAWDEVERIWSWARRTVKPDVDTGDFPPGAPRVQRTMMTGWQDDVDSDAELDRILMAWVSDEFEARMLTRTRVEERTFPDSGGGGRNASNRERRVRDN